MGFSNGKQCIEVVISVIKIAIVLTGIILRLVRNAPNTINLNKITLG
jgi:hypothetical protein